LIAQQATSALNLGQVGSLLKTVVITIVTAEAILAVLLFPRFLIRGDSIGDATWYSVFYSISAFNNAGFTIHPGGGAHFASGPWASRSCSWSRCSGIGRRSGICTRS